MTEHVPIPTYTSYVLRLRQQQTPQGGGHQVMLHRVDSGERHYFSDLDTFVQYLETHGQITGSERGESQ